MNLSMLAIGSGWGDEILRGLAVTLGLAAVSFVLGSVFGLVGALAESSGSRALARAVGGFNALVRSLPELLIIFVVYYGLSIALQGFLAPFGVTGFIALDAFWSGALSIALIHSAYCAEVFRGALQAVPRGPLEAAAALGLHPRHSFVLVKLPLALRYALPGLVNLSVVTLKITPLVSAIGLQDLMRSAGDAGKNTREYITFYLIALGLYLIVAAVIYAVQLSLERRLARGVVT